MQMLRLSVKRNRSVLFIRGCQSGITTQSCLQLLTIIRAFLTMKLKQKYRRNFFRTALQNTLIARLNEDETESRFNLP